MRPERGQGWTSELRWRVLSLTYDLWDTQAGILSWDFGYTRLKIKSRSNHCVGGKKIIMIRFSCLDSIYRIAELWRCHLARRSRFTVGERRREGEEAKNTWKELPLTKKESQERTGSWEPWEESLSRWTELQIFQVREGWELITRFLQC